jgi:XTP/dITP diphosphohydrolase
MRIIIATTNRHKRDEIGRMIAPVLAARFGPVDWLDLADAGVAPPDEIGATFEEIALLKARHAARATGLPAIGDDSGLAVDALGGAPGVRSHRFAGPDATDRDNNRHLLELLRDVAEAQRGAAYSCAVALVVPGGVERIATGRCEGRILHVPRGSGGFGYDPLFFIPSLGKTMAELAPDEKDAVSHRGAAVRALRAHLPEALSGDALGA